MYSGNLTYSYVRFVQLPWLTKGQQEVAGSRQHLSKMTASTLKLSCETVDDNKVVYTSWDDLFANADNIQWLVCDYNNLTTLPESIGKLTQLTHLFCDHNHLTSLPESIGNLSQLQVFHCNHNKLTTVPESIGNLQQLRRISLHNNQITHLPESIGNLQQLTHLCVSLNKLASLPISLGNLSQLESLSIGWNDDLTEFPDQLLKCKKLRSIDYADTPMDIPQPLFQKIKAGM